MSHELMVRADGTSALAYAASGGVPWHRLGQSITDTKSVMEMYNKSGFAELTMEKQELALFSMRESTNADTGKVSRVPTYNRDVMKAFRALVRRETGEVFAVTSEDYGILTPMDFLNTLEPIRAKFDADWESALLTFGGREMSASIKLLGIDLRVGDDKLNPYLFAHTRNDGLGRMSVIDTVIRPICANTVKAALGTRSKAAFALDIVHREGNVTAKLKEAEGILLGTIRAFEEWQTVAQSLLAFEMSETDFDIFRDVLFPMPTIMPRKNARMVAPIVGSPIGDLSAPLVAPVANEPVLIKRYNERIGFFNTAWEEEKSYTGANAWAAFNAATGYANHGISYQKSINSTEDKRLTSIMFGKGAEMSVTALNTLTTMAGIKI